MKLLVQIIFFSLILISCNQQDKTVTTMPSGIKISLNTNNSSKWSNNSLQNGLELKMASNFLFLFSEKDYINGLSPIDEMAANWNNSISEVILFKVPSETTSNKRYPNLVDYRDNEMGVYLIDDWFNELSPAALAITQFFGITKNKGTNEEYLELIHADILINTEQHYFSNDPYDETSYDIQSVILHEMGHFIGLQHNIKDPSVMAPHLRINQSERSIYPADANKVLDRYQSMPVKTMETPTILGAIKSKTKIEIQRGIIELRSNGKCYHYLNNELQEIH
jgi:hypothetical protein